MASCYLINNGGDWTDTTKWAASDISALANINDGATPTASDDVFLTANSGQCTISATSVGKTLTCTGYTNTLTHGAFDLTISGTITLVIGMTYTPSSVSSRLVMAATGTLTTGGKLLWSFKHQGGSVVTLGDNLSFVNQKTALYEISSTSTNLNGFTISGSSTTNRLLIKSLTIGTATTITVASGTFANADFRDITFSSASNLDLSAITGLSGDCGGNSITGGGTVLTFTPAVTQTYTGGTDNWSTLARWTSRVPLPQDAVLMSGVTGGTITGDMPRLGKSIDWTGASGSPTWNLSTSNQTLYGSLILITGMTYTQTQTMRFEGRSSFVLSTAGNTLGSSVTIAMINGTLTLQDNLIITNTLSLANGTFNSNNFNITAVFFNMTGSTTRTLSMGSSLWTLTGTGTVWGNATTTNETLNVGTSTIIISDTSASSKTFDGGGATYNNLQITGGGAGAVIITGANTFNRILVIGGTKSITLPGSTTTTLLGETGLGNGTNLITFTASAGSATISQSGGIVNWDYVSLTNIPSTGGAAFYAGPTTHSTDGGGNTGWIFTNAPGGGGGGKSTYAPGGVLGLACAGCL